MTLDEQLVVNNLLSWAAQVFIVGSLGALLPLVFRIRHPRSHLMYCQLVLLACLILPLIQVWQQPVLEVSETPSTLDTVIPTDGTPEEAVAATIRWDRILAWGLILGMVGRLCWLGSGLWRIRRYLAAAIPMYRCPEFLKRARNLTGVNALICISDGTVGPVTFGFIRPVILVPPSLFTMGEDAQCGIACHELLHVRRKDWLVATIEEVVGAVLWFHPAIWWLLAQTRLLREQLVDAEVVRLTALPDRYIDALLAIAGANPAMEIGAAPLFLRRRHLTQRIDALLTEVSMSKVRLLLSYVSIIVVLALAGRIAFSLFPMIGQAETRTGTVSTPTTQIANQDSGFVVNRQPAFYPAEALQRRIEGTVIVEVTFNANREIVDTRIVSGPEELRRAALQTALQGSYGAEVSRVVQVVVDFKLPAVPAPPTSAGVVGGTARSGVLSGVLGGVVRTNEEVALSPPPPPPPPLAGSQSILSAIEISGLEEPHLSQLRAQIQPFQGRVTSREITAAIRALALTYREDRPVGISRIESAYGTVTLRITFGAPATVIVGPTEGEVSSGTGRVRVGGAVLQTNIIQRVDPVYPPLAKHARIQGVVVLEAVIDLEGRVTRLGVISGHPLLTQSAIDAVKQWVYRPIEIDGQRQEVVSTITVNFSLQE